MTKYTGMSPVEAGAEFHRILAAQDAEAMEQFIFDHHLDETSGLYTLAHERIPHDGRVTYKLTIRLADEEKRPRTYILEKDLADYAGGGSKTSLYEILPDTETKCGETFVVHDSLRK